MAQKARCGVRGRGAMGYATHPTGPPTELWLLRYFHLTSSRRSPTAWRLKNGALPPKWFPLKPRLCYCAILVRTPKHGYQPHN